MNVAVFTELLLRYGPALAHTIVEWNAEKKEVTPADSAELMKLAQYTSADSLAAQGMKIEDGKVVRE